MGLTIVIFAVTIAVGLLLGRIKIKGISIGSTWILFVGIILSHFGAQADPTALSFVKDFGLILFVFAIGLQVGPGFVHSFKKGGLSMNALAALMVLMTVGVTLAIHFITGESLADMVGVMSGAVTNTPGLGAAQQTAQDVMAAQSYPADEISLTVSTLASSYAISYPLGVLAVIGLLIAYKSCFKVNLDKEKKDLESDDDTASEAARRMHCEVENPAIFGRSIRDIAHSQGAHFIISRIMRNGEVSVPNSDTVLEKGDKLLIVTSNHYVNMVRIIFGEEIPMHQSDWDKLDKNLVTRRLTVTKSSLTGKTLGSMHIRETYGVTITRVIRAGIELVAQPNLILQMGDGLMVVGTESDIKSIVGLVGNKKENLSHPNLAPIFAGIALGVIFGSIPIHFPGIPQPIRLGLAGGTLIIAILLGHFGPKLHITTYTTLSANMMLREVGIALFMAAVGLGAGANFVESLVSGGYWWILYGFLITIIPIIIMMLLCRFVLHLNFYKMCGLIAGSCTNPTALSFSQESYGTDYVAVNYATVYPLTMFMRVLVAQLLILLAFAA
ncbi:MAG: putative transporter [Bacteroidales bacterium]|nr:putative transporter [Bacteroidales bacterium]